MPDQQTMQAQRVQLQMEHLHLTHPQTVEAQF
jgi:hypothetical protein